MLRNTVFGIIGGLAALVIAAVGFNTYSERRRPDLPPPVDAQSRTISTPYGALRAFEAGSGPTVLLLHSFNAAGTTYEMRPIFEDLARDHRVVAVDWLGFGLSDRPDIEYGPDVYQDVLGYILDDLGPEPVDVIALSLPAQYVAIRAGETPERFRSLVLISPTGLGRFGGAAGAPGETILRVFDLPLIGRTFYNGLTLRPVIRRFLVDIFADPARLDPQYEWYAWATARQLGALHAPVYFVAGLLNDPGAEDAYRSLRTPTLLVFGDHPRFTDPEAAAAVAGQNSALRFETIAGSGDLPQWEQREETLRRVRAFLTGTVRVDSR
jgi:pimeloyl-ACP methyl ester carboxylesterase